MNEQNDIPANVGIRRLILTQFRNHARLELDIDKNAVVLFGANGAGKTNILEAISMFNPGRSLRSAELLEMAREGDDGGPFAISALIGVGEEERRIGVGLDLSKDSPRKIVRMDGKDVSARQTLESIRLIWVTPQMDRIFAGPQGERRKFMDRIVLSFLPELSPQIAAYERAMKERQKLLENSNPDAVWLRALEEQAATNGVAIASARIEAMAMLQSEINKRPDGVFPKAGLRIEGNIENALLDGKGVLEIEREFAALLHNNRHKDAMIGRSLIGTHRTEIFATHLGNGMDAEKCSTGEQKALLMGIIIAQARLIADGAVDDELSCFSRPNPIILIDEANAHFDEKRRSGLSEELLSLRAQSWLTGTDKSLFESFGGGAEYYQINQGKSAKKL